MPISFFELFQRGGPVMWPILFCSILALTIVIERVITFYRADIDTSRFFSEITRAIQTRKFAQAEQLCDQNPSPLAHMVKAGIQRFGRSRTEIMEAMEETLAEEVPSLQRYVPLLGSVAHMAPLLGLLGTVTGLVRCFQVVQEKTTTLNPVNPGDLAGGIWEALLTTVFGLVVAIPAYGMYNYLAHRINATANNLEAVATKLSHLLVEEHRRTTTESFSSQNPVKSHATS